MLPSFWTLFVVHVPPTSVTLRSVTALFLLCERRLSLSMRVCVCINHVCMPVYLSNLSLALKCEGFCRQSDNEESFLFVCVPILNITSSVKAILDSLHLTS